LSWSSEFVGAFGAARRGRPAEGAYRDLSHLHVAWRERHDE
jgi:hypothetical protein